MKNYRLLFILLLVSSNIFGQLKVNTNRQVEINGGNGGFSSTAPRININSSGTSLNSTNTGLSVFNTNTTVNNWTRLHFATKRTDNGEEDFVSLAAQYRNRSSSKGADFHIATLNRGYYASRFAIYNNSSDANDVKFFFNTGYTGYGRGVWLDDSGYGEPTFRPNRGNYGCLGTSSYYWYKLYVKYANYNYHATITSDKRKKKEIQDIGKGTISKIKKVRGVKYKLKAEDVNEDNNFNTNDIYGNDKRPTFSPEADIETINIRKQKDKQYDKKDHFGFIAQELESIFPEVVEYDSVNDTYGVKYTALIPIIIEGMKEQQDMIDAQSLKIKELETSFNGNKKSGKLKGASTSTNKTESDMSINAFLYQNTPNPFTYDTEIKYYIPENAQNAMLNIYNMNGTQLKSIELHQKGISSIIINGNEFTAGMYMYALIANGQIIDTKQMVLTE